MSETASPNASFDEPDIPVAESAILKIHIGISLITLSLSRLTLTAVNPTTTSPRAPSPTVAIKLSGDPTKGRERAEDVKVFDVAA